MQQIWTALKPNGPNHLGFLLIRFGPQWNNPTSPEDKAAKDRTHCFDVSTFKDIIKDDLKDAVEVLGQEDTAHCLCLLHVASAPAPAAASCVVWCCVLPPPTFSKTVPFRWCAPGLRVSPRHRVLQAGPPPNSSPQPCPCINSAARSPCSKCRPSLSTMALITPNPPHTSTRGWRTRSVSW